MLTKNLDVQKGFVNGARGIVVGFQKDNDGKYLLFNNPKITDGDTPRH
jgi:hypothetical protein